MDNRHLKLLGTKILFSANIWEQPQPVGLVERSL